MNNRVISLFSLALLLVTSSALAARLTPLYRAGRAAAEATKTGIYHLSSQALLSYAVDPIENKMPIVVLDCCGSVGDPRSASPVEPFRETYKAEGVEITEQEARAPMGIGKRDHIAQIPILCPDVARRWYEVKGRKMNEEDIERMFSRYKPLQVEVVKNFVTIIPGAVEAAHELREMGIPYIGGTTGFFREAAQAFGDTVALEGFYFDNIVCTDDTGGKGRPAKGQKEGGYEMLLESMNRAGVSDPRLVIKAGDSEGDIEEGRRIEQVYGEPVWTVGFYMTGNYFPFTQEEIDAMDPSEFAYHVNYAKHRLGRASILIPSIAQLPQAVRWIIELNAMGIKPSQYNQLHDELRDCQVR